MLPRRFLLLADNPLTLAQLRAEIEDLGEETRCQTALTAEEALFRLSQESVDALLLLRRLRRRSSWVVWTASCRKFRSCRRGSPCFVCPRWRRHTCRNALNWHVSC